MAEGHLPDNLSLVSCKGIPGLGLTEGVWITESLQDCHSVGNSQLHS